MKHVVIDYICFSCVVISLSNHGLVAAGTCFWQQQDEWEGDRNVHNRTMTCWLHGQREKEMRKAPWGDCCVETVAWLWIHRKDWQSFFFFHKKAKWNCGWLFSMLKQEGKKLSIPKAILHLFRRNKPLRYCKLRWCQDKINRWFPPGCSLERGSDRHIRTSESARGNTPCKYTECMPWYDTPVGRVCKALHIPALGLIDK